MIRLFNLKEQKKSYLYHNTTLHWIATEGMNNFNIELPEDFSNPGRNPWVPIFKIKSQNKKHLELEIHLERGAWVSPSFLNSATAEKGHARFTRDDYLEFSQNLNLVMYPIIKRDFNIDLTTIKSADELISHINTLNPSFQQWKLFLDPLTCLLPLTIKYYNRSINSLDIKIGEMDFSLHFNGQLNGLVTKEIFQEQIETITSKLLIKYPWFKSHTSSNLWDEF